MPFGVGSAVLVGLVGVAAGLGVGKHMAIRRTREEAEEAAGDIIAEIESGGETAFVSFEDRQALDEYQAALRRSQEELEQQIARSNFNAVVRDINAWGAAYGETLKPSDVKKAMQEIEHVDPLQLIKIKRIIKKNKMRRKTEEHMNSGSRKRARRF